MEVGMSFRCLLTGHDDLIRRESDRMYLECCECGRHTRGWEVGRARRKTSPQDEDANGHAAQLAAA
jgi:hypothetical protein